MEIKNILKGVLTFALFIASLNFCAAEDVKVYAGVKYIEPNSTWVEVPVNFNATKGFLSADFYIFYNESILNITDPAKIRISVLFAAGMCARQPGVGIYKCALPRTTDVMGDIEMISINFSVLGGCGIKSNIGVSVDYIQNSSYHLLTYSITNGSVTIKCDATCCPAGTFCNTTTHLCQPFLCYGDADNDGYGNLTNTTLAIVGVGCRPGYVNKSNDCNDYNASINPGRPEIYYNGVDDDCNISTRDCDKDNDGYNATAGGVCTGNDCNDTNASINPGTNEICNGIDDNCNNQIDDECCTPSDLDGNNIIDIFDVVAGLEHLSYGASIVNENCTARNQQQIDLFDLLTLISGIGTNTI